VTISGSLAINGGATGLISGARYAANSGNIIEYMNGYTDEVRVSKGIARWVSGFSPSTTRYAVDDFTKILLRANNGYLDRSNYIKRASFNVNSRIDCSFKIMGKSSLFCDGSSYITLQNSSDFILGGGDFTVDFWVYKTTTGTCYLFGCNSTSTSGTDYNYGLYYDSSGPTLIFRVRNVAACSFTGAAANLSSNVWKHIAVVRSSGTIKIYVDGTSIASNSYATAITCNTYSLGIGAEYNGTSPVTGYIDEFRISVGTARWTATFVPQLTQYFADQYTKLLMHFDSDGYNDVSNANIRKTNFAGTLQISTAQKKFGNSSASFDGSSSYILVSNFVDFDFIDGDFAVDMWVRFNSLASNQIIMTKYQNANNLWVLGFSSTTGFYFKAILSSVETDFLSEGNTVGLNPGVWYHAAVFRHGTSWFLTVNGLVASSTTSSVTMSTITGNLNIGNDGNGGNYFNGYMSEVRVSKGTSRWTGAFTLPTSKYSADEYTKLLLHLDGDINDYSNCNFRSATPYNTAAIFRPTYKFGSSSVYFYSWSNIDYLSVGMSTIDFDFSGSNFVIDCWIKPDSSDDNYVFGIASSSGLDSVEIKLVADQLVFSVTMGGTNYQSSGGDLSVYNTWYHVAVMRSGNNFYSFVNGVMVGSNVISGSFSSFNGGFFSVGTNNNHSATGEFYGGQVDEFRVSVGTDRGWSSGFSVPTFPYDTDSFTKLLLHFDSNLIDSSGTGKTVTAHGDAVFTNTLVTLPGGATRLDGNSDYVTYDGSSDFNLLQNDFEISAWVYIPSRATPVGSDVEYTIISIGDKGSNKIVQLMITYLHSVVGSGLRVALLWNIGSGDAAISSTDISGTWTYDAWHHVAITRFKQVAYVFVDGVLNNVAACAFSFDTSTVNNILWVGARKNASLVESYWYGNINELRVSNGTPRWIDSFTPVTSKYISDNYTKLLCHYDNDFNDYSANTRTLSVSSGNPVIKNDVFKPNNISGLYFNGSTLITAPNITDLDIGTVNFTIDWWEYTTSGRMQFARDSISPGYSAFVIVGNNLYMSSSVSQGWDIASNRNAFGSVITNAWTHYALTRSNNTFYAFRNGVQQDTWTIPSNLGLMPGIGVFRLGITLYGNYTGYLSNFRLTKGIARWTSNFTPPVLPYDADRFTIMLLTGNGFSGLEDMNSSITSAKVVTKFGSPYITNAQFDLGTSSVYFDGTTGCYIVYPYGIDWLPVGNEVRTVDFWLRPSNPTLGTAQYIMGYGSTGASAFAVYFADSSGKLSIKQSTDVQGTIVLTANTWYHVAVVHDGQNQRLFVNGNLNATAAGSLSTAATDLYIGSSNTVHNNVIGYVSDFRVSRKVRWKGNFVPPSRRYT
jgi:hypothetical protein